MPEHRIPRARLHEDLIAIEREGEHVLSVVPDGDVFVVVTRYPTPDHIETRGVA